jgi:hypothetical protein
LCNFLLLSLAAKGKKNVARSLCNFLLLSLAAKEKFKTGQGRGRVGQGVQGSKK